MAEAVLLLDLCGCHSRDLAYGILGSLSAVFLFFVICLCVCVHAHVRMCVCMCVFPHSLQPHLGVEVENTFQEPKIGSRG